VLPALYFYAPDRQPSGFHARRDVVLPDVPGGPLGGRSAREIGADGEAQLSPVTDTGGRRGYGANGVLAPAIPSLLVDSVFSFIEVDSAVVRVEGSAAPEYPPELLQQGVEGEVETEFVVDTTGHVDTTSVRVIWSSHRDFTESVERALGGMLFRPAMRGFHRVRQLVQQKFRFRVASPAQGAS
jgi:TonB family protein